MEIKQVNPELAFSRRLTGQQLATLARRGYRMLVQAGKPEEFREADKRQAQKAGLRYAEFQVEADVWTEERFLAFEELLFPREARPAVVCSLHGRRAAVMALVWDAIQRSLTVEQAEARARQLALILPEVAKEYLRKNSPAYGFTPKLRVVEGLPFPLDDETLPGGFHRPT